MPWETADERSERLAEERRLLMLARGQRESAKLLAMIRNRPIYPLMADAHREALAAAEAFAADPNGDGEAATRAAIDALFKREVAVSTVAQQLGKRYAPERVALENYRCEHRGQREILRAVQALAERLPEALKAGESLVLFGPPGTGKDHLLAGLLYRAAATVGVSVYWTTGAELYSRLRDGIKTDTAEADLLRPLRQADILAVSDPIPPGADPSGWAINHLYAVVDYRYGRLLPTWVTVNADSEEDAADKLAPQLLDRLRDGGHMLPCFWPSYRAAKGERRSA